MPQDVLHHGTLYPHEKRILELWDSGLSTSQIHRATGLPLGKVSSCVSNIGGGNEEHRLFKKDCCKGSGKLLAAMQRERGA